jgi:hypothetical protein
MSEHFEPGFEGAANSALILTNGETPLNHAIRLGDVLRYAGPVAVVSTARLAEELLTVDMFSPGLPTSENMQDGNNHYAERHGWVRDWAKEHYGFEPDTYDVHLLDPDMASDSSAHWSRITGRLVPMGGASRHYSWHYTSFQEHPGLAQMRRTETGMPDWEFSAEQIQSALELIKGRHLPHPVESATAVLERAATSKPLRGAAVTFGNGPETRVTFKVVQDAGGRRDRFGDLVRETVEETSRSVPLLIPAGAQALIDQITAASEAEREIRLGDEIDYYTSARDFLDVQLARILAPIYNVL